MSRRPRSKPKEQKWTFAVRAPIPELRAGVDDWLFVRRAADGVVSVSVVRKSLRATEDQLENLLYTEILRHVPAEDSAPLTELFTKLPAAVPTIPKGQKVLRSKGPLSLLAGGEE